MPKKLAKILSAFNASMGLMHARALCIYATQSKADKWQTRYLTESLIHDTWQDWSFFCRSLILSSCRGCATVSGNTLPYRAGDNSWEGISYTFKNPRATTPKKISFKREEPTWGDVSKVLDGIQALSPPNSATLSIAFGLSNLTDSATHLQKIRNCIAHKNVETISAVKALYPYYTIPADPIETHEFIWLSSPGSNMAFFKWIDDFRTIAKLAVS